MRACVLAQPRGSAATRPERLARRQQLQQRRAEVLERQSQIAVLASEIIQAGASARSAQLAVLAGRELIAACPRRVSSEIPLLDPPCIRVQGLKGTERVLLELVITGRQM